MSEERSSTAVHFQREFASVRIKELSWRIEQAATLISVTADMATRGRGMTLPRQEKARDALKEVYLAMMSTVDVIAHCVAGTDGCDGGNG